MRDSIKHKLEDLIAEASEHGPAAVVTVLHMLQGACLHGTQNEFAKHCCQFSPLRLGGGANIELPPGGQDTFKVQ